MLASGRAHASAPHGCRRSGPPRCLGECRREQATKHHLRQRDFPSSCLCHAANCVGCTSWCEASSAIVFSPRIAFRATRALNTAEWLRLGFLIDFVPPVGPGQKSTYTLVRITGAASLRVIRILPPGATKPEVDTHHGDYSRPYHDDVLRSAHHSNKQTSDSFMLQWNA